MGLHYIKWLKFQRLKWYFEEHPEELVGQTKESYDEICHMGYDERFLETCESVLKDLKK